MRCTNCGWDNADENVRCEKCNSPLGSNGEKEEPTVYGKTIRETERDGIITPKKTVPENNVNEEKPLKNNNAPVHGGTINPWATPQSFPSISYCKLSPLPIIPNEKHMPGDVEFKGDRITLNRANLDPDNMAISQSNQAELICKNGKWYIKDESAFKTTYIHARKETPLQNGDIILMGNRRFEFTEE